MTDPVDSAELATLEALRRAQLDAHEASTDALADATTDWFAADTGGSQLPIGLDASGRGVSRDLDALSLDILAPLAR